MSTQTKPSTATESVPYASLATPAAQEQIPKWVGVMVALVIVGSMLGGGGLWFWSYHNRPDPKSLTEVRGSSMSTAARSIASAAVPVQQTRTIAPGIQQNSPTSYNVTAGDFSLVASKQPAPTDWIVTLLYRKSDLLTADEQAARMARMRLGNDPLFAKSLNVTDEQVTKLKALPAVTSATPRLTIAPADTEKLKKMWTAFIATNPPKPDEAAKVVAAVQDTGKANLESFRKSLVDGVKEIRAILTPEQIAPFKPATTP